MGTPPRQEKSGAAVAIAPVSGAEEGLVGGTLSGTFVSGSAGFAVVAPPHPLYGGTKESPVVVEIARALNGLGVGTLCFDWRGVGHSAGTSTGDEASALADYVSALAFDGRDSKGPLFACGYSFGAVAAIRSAIDDPAVDALVLVAPPASMIESLPLHRLRIPIFLAVGDADSLVDPSSLTALFSALDTAQICLLPGADHFFMGGGLPELGRELAGWLERTHPG